MSWLFKDPIITVTWLNFMPNQTVKNGLRAKKIKLLQMKFFLKNNKIFMYLLARFILKKLKRIVRADPELSA